MKIKKGEYVLATLYSDGDFRDPWYIGFLDKEENGKFYIAEDVKKYGFRRIKKISLERGKFILENKDLIEKGVFYKSLWWWYRRSLNHGKI